MITNPIPIQQYLTRWATKAGSTVDLITEMSELDITYAVNNPDHSGFFVITGINDKGWPVSLRLRTDELSMWIIAPHGVYLAARPKLGLQ